MQLKHVAALLLPLSSVVNGRPIESRSVNGLLNPFSTIGSAGDSKDAVSQGSFLSGLFKRQIMGWSFEPVSMVSKFIPLHDLPIIGLRNRDAEADEEQEKRALDGTLNILDSIRGGFFGILKRETGEFEKRGGFLGSGCLLNIESDTPCAD